MVCCDVIPKAPAALATVTYGNTEVYLGSDLSDTKVALQPNVTFDAEYDSLYTLAMIDPDVPSRKAPTLSPVKHWLVINIPGSDVGKGETLNSYIPPSPSPGSGPHRYIFLIYKQDWYIDIDPVKKVKISLTRIRFSIEDFAKMYKLGDLVAGNFFFYQVDDKRVIYPGLTYVTEY